MDKAQILRISGLIADGKDTEREAYEASNYESQKNNPMDVEKEEYVNVVETSNSMVEEFNHETQRRHYSKTSEPIKAVAVTTEDFDLKETINQMITKDNGTFQCKTCGRVGRDGTNMKKHVEIHIDGLSYDCTLCDKTFRSKSSYNNHMYRDKTHKIFQE